MSEEDPLLTTSEIADWLKVRVQSVARWCRVGKLKAIRAGREYRVRRSEVERFIQYEPQEVEEGKKAKAPAAKPGPSLPTAQGL